MSIKDSLAQVLKMPTPDALWQLRADLLESGLQPDSRALTILGEFHGFLNELVASSTSRQYSHFASILDLGAVGSVAIQNLLEMSDSEDWSQRLFAGALGEALMVLAARQYVKAWEEELKANYNAAAWFLTGEFWRLSVELKPDLPNASRRRLIARMETNLRDEGVEGIVRAAYIVHFFQLLLFVRLQLGG
jgi:hypothetical protein